MLMAVCLKGGKVFDLRNNVLLDADVIIEDGKIRKVAGRSEGKVSDAASKGARIIDASGCVVMPGFKNAHTHSPMVFFRSLADDLPLERWLNEVIFPYEAKLTQDDVYFGSLLAIMEYLKNGITACQDMYFFQDSVAKAFVQAGMRCVLNGSLTSNAKSPDYDTQKEEDASYERIMSENDRFSSLSPLISYALGVHSTYTTSARLMKGASRAVRELRKGFYLHMNETAFEASTAFSKFGAYNVQYADSLGLFDYGGGIFHGVHMQDAELDIMKAKGVGAALNPCSNAKLNSGVPDFERYARYRILTGLGTDGASSNNSLDIFKEMWTLQALNHIKFDNILAPKPYDIVRAATEGSAKFMKLDSSLYVEEGQNADLIMVDIGDVNAVPFTDICKYLVYSANVSNIRMTMVAGKVLYCDGKYDIGFDKNDVIKEVVARLNRIRNGK
ncbi:MAG TPA: amidohydrolase [Spirochaetaceae bacterium]|nr:amidohydrolase [Spirochaetaceae bacterium]